MPTVTASPERLWRRAGIAVVLALSLWRVALLPFVEFDLFVDDAQYWLWSRELAWGYFSKPPLIAWIIALSTGLGGDGAFWIRLPLPLIHGVTALVLLGVGTRLFGARIGALAGVGYATLPGVSWGSLLLSTDTPLLLAFASALAAWIRLTERRSLAWAFALGAAVGFGLLAKYAMIYFVLCAAVAAARVPSARIEPRDAALAAVVALAIVAPNLAWNLANDLTTFRHTADNAGWESFRPQFGSLAEFLGGQFAVMGPILFAAYLAAAWSASRGRAEPRRALLIAFSLPVLVVVSGRALIAGAYANWAAATYAAGTIAAVAALAPRRGWLVAGLGLNLAIALAVPLAATRAESLTVAGRPVFERYLGRHDISRRIGATAEAEGLGAIVARNRDILADLFYTLRDSNLVLYAEPRPGPPAHHYAQRHALPAGAAGDVLYVSTRSDAPRCAGSVQPREVARWTADRGARRQIVAYRMDAACFEPAG